MAITLDTIVAGTQVPKAITKTGVVMAAVGAMRGYTPWYVAGNPGAATANAVGINGAAVSGVIAGAIPRTNPPGGTNAYLARLGLTASTAGTLWLIDRLWHNSGLSVTSTTAQAITPAALPTRDANGTSNGDQVMAGIEWSAAGGAGTPTVTLTYTDQGGNTGASATLTGVASPGLGTFELFTLGAGDTGIRAPTSLIQSATRTSGTMHLVLFRMLAQIEISGANTPNAIDAITGGLPRIPNDATLQLLWFPAATTATNFIGNYVETHVIP